ncbi:ecto-NOX disulfide-thiol exchanger 1-like [Brachionichthys hirsutus]|uniref:ecto-NOX disulfide-thiol exchanger 1-like n=1 Tax=Brachionichthys hirsutus TaxID=412623 RepID=UPI003604F73D
MTGGEGGEKGGRKRRGGRKPEGRREEGAGRPKGGQEEGAGSPKGGQEEGAGSPKGDGKRGQEEGAGRPKGGQEEGAGSPKGGQEEGAGRPKGGQEEGAGSPKGGQEEGAGSPKGGQEEGAGRPKGDGKRGQEARRETGRGGRKPEEGAGRGGRKPEEGAGSPKGDGKRGQEARRETGSRKGDGKRGQEARREGRKRGQEGRREGRKRGQEAQRETGRGGRKRGQEARRETGRGGGSLVYRSLWSTGVSGLRGPLVYRGLWSTGASGLRGSLVYRSLWADGADQNHWTGPVRDHGVWASAGNGVGVVPVDISSQPLVSDPLCIQRFDPNLGLVASMTPMMTGISLAPPPPAHDDMPVIKEVVHCSSCTLFPQNPNLPAPSTRERPPGCKTVFAGGLPENATEEIIREVFDQCGEISAIRKSKKNFCHIRFVEEFMVDKALYLSGYRMRIGSSTEKKDSGRIHVDFAQARDDLYEWECNQRLLAREGRHHRRFHEDCLGPPSPPPIVHYSEHEAALLAERLKGDHKFSAATAVLLAWIDRGEVNRRTANQFYAMIQSANGHVRRLMAERAQREEELQHAKETFKNALMAILSQFEQIAAVFTATTRQKSWDHLSKAQRRSVDVWRKQCEELRHAQSEEITGIRREEEMDVSDEGPRKRMKTVQDGVYDQASLKEENDSLRWQLDACRNEVELLRREQSRTSGLEDGLAPGQEAQEAQEAQDKLLQQRMHSMQQHLLILQEKLSTKEAELEQANEEHRYLEGEVLTLRDKVGADVVEGSPGEALEKVLNGCGLSLYLSRGGKNDVIRRGVASEKEAVLLGVVSTFLHVHPFGANLEYLYSYVRRLDSQVSPVDLERLLLRLPSMFRQELSGVGATLEKRWTFCGFSSLSSP